MITNFPMNQADAKGKVLTTTAEGMAHEIACLQHRLNEITPPPNGTIIDKCPVCLKDYTWDGCFDIYLGAKTLKVADTTTEFCGYNTTLHLCTCGGVIAVSVAYDLYGEQVYIPSTKEL